MGADAPAAREHGAVSGSAPGSNRCHRNTRAPWVLFPLTSLSFQILHFYLHVVGSWKGTFATFSPSLGEFTEIRGARCHNHEHVTHETGTSPVMVCVSGREGKSAGKWIKMRIKSVQRTTGVWVCVRERVCGCIGGACLLPGCWGWAAAGGGHARGVHGRRVVAPLRRARVRQRHGPTFLYIFTSPGHRT